jgi:excinuclease UvrABC nuclease subunit
MTQYLNNYLGQTWVRFDAPFAGYLPEYSCCYCIFSGNGELLYVGQTLNLKARFYSHRASKSFPDDAYIKIRCGDKYGDWAMREARLIRRLRPPLNARAA